MGSPVRAHQQARAPHLALLADLARKAPNALQDGRPGYRALWRHFVSLSVAALKKDYDDLGVSFDLWKGEADVDPLISGMIADLEAKGLVELSDGARIIRVAEESDKKEVPPIILVNSEGAVGYHATDIATIIDRVQTNAPDRIFYVVDGRQRLHFEQVFRASGRAGRLISVGAESGLLNGSVRSFDGGGGAFSGKDPTKVDRSAAYAARYLAKNVVAAGLAERCTIQVAYAIGVADPMSLLVDTHGTGDVDEQKLAKALQEIFPLRPTAIRRSLKLNRPIYRRTSAYGHFGRAPDKDGGFSWEQTNLVSQLKSAFK